MVFKKNMFLYGGNLIMGTKVTRIISYLLIISIMMTGLVYTAEEVNLSDGIGTYGQVVQKHLMLISVM